MTQTPDGQASFFDQDTWYGKMSQEHSVQTKAVTSRQSSKKPSASQNRKPPVLKFLKKDGLPGGDTGTWTDDGAFIGEFSTRNTSESPSVAVESLLSQILEDAPHPKYYLSAAACTGILRRAERRGKELPEQLKTALVMQSESGGGCEGGGKGALVQTEKSGTLGTGNDQTIFCVQGNCASGSGIDCKTPWETQANRVYSSDGKWPTLNAECGGNKPAVVYSFDSLASNSMKSSNPHSGCREVEIAKTLDTTIPEPSKNQGGIAILDMSHANDVIRECGDTVPTLQSRMGTGGNQVPLTYALGRSDQLTESDVACTQSARQYKSATDLAVTNMAVRRLTPLECERLQGAPDYWTDIGAWRDEKGKLHKESSDAARYKAIGNSIAIPPWKWVLKRLCAQYEREATMGSLFDGLGCFPLIWTQLNGWGSVKWASEIEPFCIAVTKRHFGDEETGERGDAWEYLTGGKNHEP